MNRWLAALTLALLTTTPALAQETGTLKQIRDRKAMVLGYREDSAPFAFVGAEGKPAGYSVDLCTMVAGAVQKQLNLPDMQTRWVKVTAQNRFDMVANGSVDLECGSTTTTLSRQQRVDFSNMTFIDGGSLLVRDPTINGARDLGGKRVAVIRGTTTDAALAPILAKLLTPVQVVAVKDHPEGLAALEQGRADAYASDRLLLIGLGRSSRERDNLSLASEYFSYEPYALAMRRNDSAFRLVVNGALARFYRSEELPRLFRRWFGDMGRPTPLLEALYILNAVPD